MPVRRQPPERNPAGEAALAERLAWNRQRATDLTPPWGAVGLGEAEGCVLRALVAEAYLAVIRQGLGADRAREMAEVAGLAWATERVREAVAGEVACTHAAFVSAAEPDVAHPRPESRRIDDVGGATNPPARLPFARHKST